MKHPPKVWIVSPGRSHDYTELDAFGDRRAMFDRSVNLYDLDGLAGQIQDALGGTHENDYLVLAGNVVVSSLVLNGWLHMHGKARMLIWGATQRGYFERVISPGMFVPRVETRPILQGVAL